MKQSHPCNQGGKVSVEVTQERLMQVLYQQAVLLFGRERAEILLGTSRTTH